MLVAILNALRSWRRYNQSLRELSRLNDRELADIGLTRARRDENARFARAFSFPSVSFGRPLPAPPMPPSVAVQKSASFFPRVRDADF